MRGWKSPRIRHDWSDLLYAEDLSQETNQSKAIDDLVGATFSYTYDGKAHTDTWSAIGALILPWEWKAQGAEADLLPERLMLAPSVSLNRVTTNGDPAGETDNLFYRIGLYGEWFGPEGWLDFIQLRGAGVYATDTEHRASLPGFEAELEPRILWPEGSIANRYFKIGFRNIHWRKYPEKEDGSDQSLLDYQVRVWLHVEGGEVQHAAESWKSTEDSFFRLGPFAQLRVNMPQLFKGFSLSALYAYLPQTDGPREHDSFFSASAALTCTSSPSRGIRSRSWRNTSKEV